MTILQSLDLAELKRGSSITHVHNQGGQKFAYQGVRNVSFSDNFAYVLNGQSQAKDKLIKVGLSSFQDTVPEFNLDKISDG